MMNNITQKKLPHNKLILALILLPFLSSSSLKNISVNYGFAGLELEYKKVTILEQNKSSSSKEASANKIKEEQIQRVIILPKQFSVSSGNLQRIYDLEYSTLTILNHKNKTLQIFDAQSIVLGKLKEISHLKNVTAQLKEKGLNSQINSFELSHYFNIALPNNGLNKIAERASGLDRIFFCNNNIVASFTLSATEIPKELQYSFSQYILHEQLLHPWISNRLVSYNRVPSRLSHQHKIILNENISFILEKIIKVSYKKIELPNNYTIDK